MSPQTAAQTIKEFHAVVDNLEKAIDTAMATTNERDYSKEYANVTVAFRAVQYNTMTLANAMRRKLDSHQIDIRYGRVKSVDIPAKDVNKTAEKVDKPKKSTKKTAKKKSTKKGK